MAQTAAHLADHVIPPVPVRQWVISVPKRLRGFLADRPAAVRALTKIFLAEIERLLCAAAGVTIDADALPATHPRRDRLRKAVTSLTIGNIGKRGDTATGGHASDDHATGGCCDANHATQKPRSHDTSRIAWAKLMARVGEGFRCNARGVAATSG
jgi:hypothetical protein